MANKKGYTAWCNCCCKKVRLNADDACPICGCDDDWEEYDGQDLLDDSEIVDMMESRG